MSEKSTSAQREPNVQTTNITVGKLRNVMQGLPDDAPVLIRPKDSKEFQKSWNNNTREVENSYQAQDDRYSPPQCLTIEIGDFSEHDAG